MWRTVFANNRIQRSSSASSSMDLINEKSQNLSTDNHMNCVNEQQSQFSKIKNSNSFRIKNRKPFEKQQSHKNQQQQLEQDLLTLKSTLIESKKKLTKKLNIKFRQQQTTSTNEKIKKKIYEQFECAIILNDCTKMAIILKENPKLNLAYDLRPDGNTFIHTAIRHQSKDALSWLASRCNRSQLNQQNSVGDSALHLAVREQSPMLVNILLNHKACNHVQNYLNRETPLMLALQTYIKYRNLKDYDSLSLNRNSDHFNSAQINNGIERLTALVREKHQYQQNKMKINTNNGGGNNGNNFFDQTKERLFDHHHQQQLETNAMYVAKFNLQCHHQQHEQSFHQTEKENNSTNLNRLINQSTVRSSNNSNRNHLKATQLDDLTAVFLNKQNCCSSSTNSEISRNDAQHQQTTNRFEIETTNYCRLMRKIVMAILHDSDPLSWKMNNSKGQTVISIAKEHQVDFVYDFICNYQKLTVIIKPDIHPQLDNQIDQNGNYLSTVDDIVFTNQQISNNDLFNSDDQFSNGSTKSISNHSKEQLKKVLIKTNDRKYDYLTFESAKEHENYCENIDKEIEKTFDLSSRNEMRRENSNTSSLDKASSKNASFERSSQRTLASITKISSRDKTSFFPISSSTATTNECNFLNSSSSSNNSSCNGGDASKLVNHYKRKTDDDDEQQKYFLKEQRSIKSQDNFNKSASMRPIQNSINRFYFRKCNRSHSIGSNFKLLDKDHNLFTSSCSLSELENSSTAKRTIQFEQQSNSNQSIRQFENLFEEQQQQQLIIDHLDANDKIDFPITLKNIPNEYSAKQQQLHQQQQSIMITKQKKLNLMNQTNVKKALTVYQ